MNQLRTNRMHVSRVIDSSLWWLNAVTFPSCSQWSNDGAVPGGLEVDANKVQLKEKIGEGSYGVVHKAAIENVK